MESDALLLQKYARTRDGEAFSTIARRHAGLVYGTALRILRNNADAEDVAQECFLALARNAATVHSSLPAWLHSAAVNRSLDFMKRESRRVKRENQCAQRMDSTAAAPEWAEIAPYVDKALEELPAELREPLILHFLDGKTQTEVADSLGVNQATVSRRISKGLELLRGSLKRSGIITTGAILAAILAPGTAQAAPAALAATLGKMAMSGISGAAKATATTTTIKGGVIMKISVLLLAATIPITVAIAVNAQEQPAAPPLSPATAQQVLPTETVTTIEAEPYLTSDDLEIGDVLTLVEAYLSQVQDMRFSFDVRTTFADANRTVKESKYDIAWDRNERQYVKRTRDDLVQIDAWNGERLKSLDQEGLASPYCKISNKPPATMGYENNPINTSVRFLMADTLAKVRSLKSELVSVERDASSELYAVKFELRPATPGKGENTTTVWLSSARGFAPVRRKVVFDGATWSDTVVSDMFEVSPGLWMPLRVTSTATPEGGQGSISEATVARESYAINSNLASEVFDIPFPDGTHVVDEVGELHDGHADNTEVDVPTTAVPVAPQLPAATEPVGPKEEAVPMVDAISAPQQTPKKRQWPYIASGAALFIVVFGAVVASRRRKPSRAA